MSVRERAREWIGRWLRRGSHWSDILEPRQRHAVAVNSDVALQASAVWACITLIAGDLASVPLLLYARRADGGRVRATTHPLYELLHSAPNPAMDSYSFVETVLGALLLNGNAYIEIIRAPDGAVVALWPLPPWSVRVERMASGGLLYRVAGASGGERELPASAIAHIRGYSRDGVMGEDPVRAASGTLALTLAAQRYAELYFAGGARPGAVLEHPQRLSDKARAALRESVEAVHGGLEQSHRLAILEEGMKLHEYGASAEDSQLIETRRYQVADIARIYRVPPAMIGETASGASYASVEQASINYVTHTIRPWASRIEHALQSQILSPREARRYYMEFQLDGLVRGDLASRYTAYSVARQWGWLSANDIRKRENMDPIDGGDTYLTPLNMAPVGQVDLARRGVD